MTTYILTSSISILDCVPGLLGPREASWSRPSARLSRLLLAPGINLRNIVNQT